MTRYHHSRPSRRYKTYVPEHKPLHKDWKPKEYIKSEKVGSYWSINLLLLFFLILAGGFLGLCSYLNTTRITQVVPIHIYQE